MIRDPFYREIETRLGEKLDPAVFERAANTLLREIYPTLVPIPGGDDAGMDGAIADGGGLPFPLVVTTAADVIGNLRDNLRSYQSRGGTRRLVVVATSQALTPERRRNLEAAAQELGFTLHQIHDRAAFTELLYRDQNWCLELLGLTGAPPALSVMPLPGRPLVGELLVGREEDEQWLVGRPGDLLVVGQPGAGKSFLLHHFAKSHDGLFVHSADLTQIAAGIRSEEPAVLIVDDAHVRLDFLPQLRRLRVETGADFRIIAASWPGSRVEIARALELPADAVRVLELLSKDDIAAIVKRTGIGGPPGLIQEIVNQAEGKPGLAVTLSTLCLRGDVKALAQGDALAQEIATVFNRLVGGDIRPLLAAFAGGGDAGMTMQAVAAYLEEPLLRVRECTASLAAGGVLVEIGRERLAVRPPALRHVLVRDVFFSGATALPIQPLLGSAPDRNELTATVVGALLRGARVDVEFRRSLMARCTSREVWAAYVHVGRQEVEWIAAEHPQWFTRIGAAALDIAPDVAVPPLLNAAVGDSRALNANPDHPLRVIGDWIAGARPGTPLVLERRRQLLVAVERWLGEGGDAAVAAHLLARSLSPVYESTSLVPGSGRTITWSQGFVTLEEAKEIRALWPRVRERVARIGPEHWGPVRDLVSAWAFRGPGSAAMADEFHAEAQAFAAEMLQDLVNMTRQHPGMLHWAHRIADRLGITLSVGPDPVFEILYPTRDLEDWRKAEVEQRERADALAEEWAKSDAGEVVDTILRCESEARLSEHPWPRLTPYICSRIAEAVADPIPWLVRLLEGRAVHDLVQPFLHRILREGRDPEGCLARRCLEDPQQRLATAITLLATEATPPDLIDLALDHLHDGREWINTVCLRGQFPEHVVLRLLAHEDDEITTAAATGEWHAAPKGEVRPALREAWRRAILRSPASEWSLRHILRDDPALACEWLERQFRENRELWQDDDTIIAVLGNLGKEERRRILKVLPADLFPSEIVRSLVGEDVELFRELLREQRLKPLHLAPLSGHPNPTEWAAKALVAMDAGYSADEIADAAFGSGYSWTGSESAMWSNWCQSFASLRAHADARVRQIGERGHSIAAERAEGARERERIERIRGI